MRRAEPNVLPAIPRRISRDVARQGRSAHSAPAWDSALAQRGSSPSSRFVNALPPRAQVYRDFGHQV